ncbi:hypothetical protein [Arthrobacter sp. ERGS1:01]|uniref:hypothetical protein n=1 Tax=Arthrobacter sp. ERGS1:01 TaxID=1704044 RepID=UPI0006B6290F|nr:hypothetical protein [Arthrobacter sp. ERGS1:01]
MSLLTAGTETTGRQDRWRLATMVAAFGVLVLLGWRQQIYHGITIGYVLAFALLPLWLPSIRRFKGLPTFFVLGLASLASGFVLYNFNKVDHQVDSSKIIINPAILVGLLLTVGVVLWARKVLPDWMICFGYGMGLMLGVGNDADVATNPWKFGYSLPVIVMVLALAGLADGRLRGRRRLLSLVALAALGAYSGLHDSRSLFAMLALVIVLVGWQMLPAGRSQRAAVARTLLSAVAVIIVVYEVGSSLLVDGYLGAAAQQRSIAQINESGSLILGGRPEMAATVALFNFQPAGFGVGIVPSLHDIAIAKAGMLAINYQPNNGYVEKYMFGSQFELHSSTGDLWVYFGLMGLVLSAFIIWLILRYATVAIVSRAGHAVVLFLAVITLWNMFFSPLYSSVTILGLAVGMAALPRRSKEPSKE